MAINSIEGTLTFMGPSRVNQNHSSTTYRSLIFKEHDTGEEVSVSECTVNDFLERHMKIGASGLFLIGKQPISGNQLIGFKNDEVNVTDQKFPFKINMLMAIWLIIGGVLLTITIIGLIIGIPMLIAGTILYFSLKSVKKDADRALKEHGFNLENSPRVIG